MPNLADAFNRKGERIVLLGDNGYPVNCDEIGLPHGWAFYQPEEFTYCRWCGAKPANEEAER